jgi:hypothetical protein
MNDSDQKLLDSVVTEAGMQAFHDAAVRLLAAYEHLAQLAGRKEACGVVQVLQETAQRLYREEQEALKRARRIEKEGTKTGLILPN